jgi:hypothetical protein
MICAFCQTGRHDGCAMQTWCECPCCPDVLIDEAEEAVGPERTSFDDAADRITEILGLNYLSWPQYRFLCQAYPDGNVPPEHIEALAARIKDLNSLN